MLIFVPEFFAAVYGEAGIGEKNGLTSSRGSITFAALVRIVTSSAEPVF